MALVGLLLLTTWLFHSEAQTDEPMLAIRLVEGTTAFYAVDEIEQIGLEGDSTLVVVTGTGSDDYATESIERIDFLWDLTSVEDPTAAALIDALHLFQNRPDFRSSCFNHRLCPFYIIHDSFINEPFHDKWLKELHCH